MDSIPNSVVKRFVGEARVVLRREPPSQRRHFRLTVPIQIAIGGRTLKANNWCLGGIQIAVNSQRLAVNTELPLRITLSFQGFEIAFVCKARVAWVAADYRSTGLAFSKLDGRHRTLLEYFAQGLMSGQMAAFEDAIRRIDIPVTPASDKPDVPPMDDEQQRRRRNRRLAIGAAYGVSGVLVAGYVLLSLIHQIFHVHVNTATLSAPVEVLNAPAGGVVHESTIRAGDNVDKQQVVLSIRDDTAIEQADLQEINVQIAQANLREKEGAFHLVKQVGVSRIEIAQSKLESLRQQLAMAQKNVKRLRALKQAGTVSDMVREEAETKAVTLAGELRAAEAESSIASRNTVGVSDARTYADLRLKGDVPEMESAVHFARQQVKLEEQKLQLLKARLDQAQVIAPFSGRVAKILVSPGNVVQKGQAVAVLEHATERVVEAYLTQSEAEYIGLDKRAHATVPALGVSYMLKIARIERANGMVDENVLRMRWNDNSERTTLVTLAFETLPSDLLSIPTGLPVVVRFPKENLFAFGPAIESIFMLSGK